MNGLIIPSGPVKSQITEAIAAKVKSQVEAKVDAHYSSKIENLEAQIAGLTEQLEIERRYGAVARTVMRALRNKGAGMPHTPDPGVTDICVKYAEMGKDFDRMLTLIKSDPFLMSEWERMLLVFRMADDGGKNGEDE